MYLVTKILFTKVYSTLVMETGVKIKLRFLCWKKSHGEVLLEGQKGILSNIKKIIGKQIGQGVCQ